jgi:uncharacterized protein (DUF1015 family)
MNLISPFAAVRPAPEYAREVIAPPYDVLDTDEAKVRAKSDKSFLHISKAQIDLPTNTDPYSDDVYNKAKENLQRLLDDKILLQDNKPNYYIYKLQWKDHVQTGLVAAASVAEYDKNRIARHEYTRPIKENDRIKQINTLNMQTGPVFLTYKYSDVIESIFKKICQNEPEQSCLADDGVIHSVWTIWQPETISKITAEFNKFSSVYIADGHHRCAAASAVNKLRVQNNEPTVNSQYFLSVIFPSQQMKILPYNRVIKGLNNLSPDELKEKIAKNFVINSIATTDGAFAPTKKGLFGMYLAGSWYRLEIKENLVPKNNSVASLDVSLLSDFLIEPFLGISDPRTDERIDFIGGIRGLSELEKKVDSGKFNVAFSMFATCIDDLMAVADDNKVMPPKSTWFEPKLADGLFSLCFD